MENLCSDRHSLVTMIDGEGKTSEKVLDFVLLINELRKRCWDWNPGKDFRFSCSCTKDLLAATAKTLKERVY